METVTTSNTALQLAKSAITSITRFIMSNHFYPDTLILNFCEGYPAFGIVFQKPNESRCKFHLFSEPILFIQDLDTEKEFVEAVSSIQGPTTYVPSIAHENSFYSWNIN